MNVELASATEQQSAVTNGINSNVTNLHHSFEELAQASGQATQLQQLVGRFSIQI